MSARLLKRSAAAAVAVYAGGSAALITANNDWSDVIYDIKSCIVPYQGPKQRVVVCGTGWAALSVIDRLDPNKTDLTVISPRSFLFYTPLLTGVTTGSVTTAAILESVRFHTQKHGGDNRTGAGYIQAEVSGVDFQNKLVRITNQGETADIAYDALVLAIGAEPATFNIPGVKEHATMLKEIEDGLKVKKQVLERLEFANTLVHSGAPEEQVRQALRWVIIGGGPTGVELTAELCDLINSTLPTYYPHLKPLVEVCLVEATGRILGMFSEETSRYAKDHLESQGAKVLVRRMVTAIEADKVDMKVEGSTQSMDYGILVWAGGIAVRPITKKLAEQIGGSQIPEAQRQIRGLKVDSKFRVVGAGDEVFAVGDCALCGLPPTAQAAYQEGKYLGRMMRQVGSSREAVDSYDEFKFTNYGGLAYVGASQAVAELKNLVWDLHPTRMQKKEEQTTLIEGNSAFVIWRSLYFTRLLSAKNRVLVAFDWAKVWCFGRDISNPDVKRCTETDKK